jgi:aromatic-L-amino-acid decarboxylase
MLELSGYMADRIKAEPTLELLAPVDLTAICFAFRNGTSSRIALAKLVDEGTAILGPVHVNGRDGIRACITNYRTTENDIDLVLSQLVQFGREAHPPTTEWPAGQPSRAE